jgi:hypothetical protein
MKKKIIFALAMFVILFTAYNSFAENVYFSTRVSFSNSQFWEQQTDMNNSKNIRKMFSNYFSGNVGMQVEMVIWDIGKKRGSRIFFKGGTDLIFSGLSFIGGYKQNDIAHTFYQYNMNGGAFYLGLGWDIFIGGTFPKTDLVWGFGCLFNFLFPSYSPTIAVSSFTQKYAFYAVPCIMLGYDIFIPNTKFKLTPQMRVGFTCNPLIPYDLLATRDYRDMYVVGGIYKPTAQYSGLYIDMSLAFSFITIKWKD